MGKVIPFIIGVLTIVLLTFILDYIDVALIQQLKIPIILVLPPLIAGLLTKDTKDGGIVGFLVVFIPAFIYGVFMLLVSFGVFPPEILAMFNIVLRGVAAIAFFTTGIMVLIFSIPFGLIGAILGFIGGLISQRILE